MMPAITTYKRKYLNTELRILLSESTILIAPAPIAIPCGQIILPIPAPMTLAAAIHDSPSPSDAAVWLCNPPKRTHVEVPDPVTNAPSAPISGAIAG